MKSLSVRLRTDCAGQCGNDQHFGSLYIYFLGNFAQCDRPVSTVMKSPDKDLVKKLAVVLVLKLAVLMALWLGFVREQRVHVDGDSVAAQFLQPVATPAKGEKP
ncbi:MAG TPA: hypothetical protein VIK28_08825 [Sedimentisphaerales bacterium]